MGLILGHYPYVFNSHFKGVCKKLVLTEYCQHIDQKGQQINSFPEDFPTTNDVFSTTVWEGTSTLILVYFENIMFDVFTLLHYSTTFDAGVQSSIRVNQQQQK